jgi:hypothetical protein
VIATEEFKEAKNEEMAEFQRLIEKAKLAVVKAYEGQETTQRNWIEAHADSYKNPLYRIQVFVLEGSPAKGCVVADYGHGVVQAFDAHCKKLKQFSSGHMVG